MGLAAVGAAGCAGMGGPREAGAASETASLKGNIRHSVCHWCFNLFGEYWDLDQTCQAALELGCESVELATSDQLPTLAEYGLQCAMVQIQLEPPFLKGFNNPAYREEVIAATREAIDAAAAFGHPNVICFTGYEYRDAEDPDSGIISREEGIANCVTGLKEVIGYAEEHNINLCLENLNTRDGSYDETPVGELQMKGHPGYQGDTSDLCIEIIEQVGSPRMKLLYDLYHAQIMEGDLIRRIHQYGDLIGHIHTAGNPGRHELDGDQEINYPPVMKALLDIGYEGFVGHEFIPTRDPMDALRAAVHLCDV